MAGRVLVAGGGISGLVAARALAARAPVVLAEADDRFGGKVATATFRGRPLDLGPDAFITRDRAAIELCDELGLHDELVAPAAGGAAVHVRGGLHRLPAGLAIGIPTDLRALAASGVVSRAGAWRARLDRIWPLPMRARDRDPSVAALVGPRLGHDVLAALVDPLVGGINAGNVAALSLGATLPQLVPLLEGRRSLSRALAPLVKRPAGDGPAFYGLQGGLSRLVDRLVDACASLGADLRAGTELVGLEGPLEGGRWRAHLRGGAEDVDAVVLALPAPDAARVLSLGAPALAAVLGEIPYASVATVTAAFPSDAVPAELGAALGGRAGDGLVGNGVLVARAPGRHMTAASFTSTKWPRSANPGEVLVRASIGRHGDDSARGLDDDGLVDLSRRELDAVLGIRATPLEVVVTRWPASFPQYVVGHRDRVERVRALLAELPGLALCGAALGGIGIPACIRSARAAAEALGRVVR